MIERPDNAGLKQVGSFQRRLLMSPQFPVLAGGAARGER